MAIAELLQILQRALFDDHFCANPIMQNLEMLTAYEALAMVNDTEFSLGAGVCALDMNWAPHLFYIIVMEEVK